MLPNQAAEASGSEEEAAGPEAADKADGREEGEIVAPPPVVDKKAERLQARRAAAKAAADELRVSSNPQAAISPTGFMICQFALHGVPRVLAPNPDLFVGSQLLSAAYLQVQGASAVACNACTTHLDDLTSC